MAWPSSSRLLFGVAHGYYSMTMLVVAVYGVFWVCLRGKQKPATGMLAHGLQDAILGLVAFFVVK